MNQTDLKLRGCALGAVYKTGDLCLQAGLWKCLTTKPQVVVIQRNERFPDVGGREVFWHLTGYIG
ncbi:hypothetical protein [Jeongeupia sp. USM3]|uniref:hypothetical protein n=1 Tax=Jeongeupia sp. USM3 TaxID=1906741 RepID=UPI00089E097E|nr:hypothetical protein [Jeongeupia sp. USM3]AOY00195.1 hypothetical protein BJP62_06885 [Jeongeupia sp. USM3]